MSIDPQQPAQPSRAAPQAHVDGDAYIWPPLITCAACGLPTSNEAARPGHEWRYGLICPTCYDDLNYTYTEANHV